MNKFLIGASILLGSILIIVNFAASSGSVHIIIGWSSPGVLAIVGIFIGSIAGYGIRGFLNEKKKENYDDGSDLNF